MGLHEQLFVRGVGIGASQPLWLPEGLIISRTELANVSLSGPSPAPASTSLSLVERRQGNFCSRLYSPIRRYWSSIFPGSLRVKMPGQIITISENPVHWWAWPPHPVITPRPPSSSSLIYLDDELISRGSKHGHVVGEVGGETLVAVVFVIVIIVVISTL